MLWEKKTSDIPRNALVTNASIRVSSSFLLRDGNTWERTSRFGIFADY